MRVLQLVTQDRGGPVDHAADVAVELARLGHDSHLAGPPGGCAVAADGHGVTWHPVTAPAKGDVRGWVRIDALVGRVRPDVVHCQDRRAGMIGRLVARRHHVRAVYTMHGVADSLAHLVPGNLAIAPARRRDEVAYHAGERVLARLAPGPVVVPCAALGRYATEHVGIPAARVRVVANGVGDEWLQRQRAPRPGEPPTAVWLGLMNPVKQLPDLVRAVADVPDLRLVLVGDGPQRGEVQWLIAAHRLDDRVVLAGYRDDPAPLLAAADFLVLPSAAEACPMALLQAMALGLPVVATGVGGVPEIVRDGRDGLVVPAGAPGELRDALLLLSKDSGLRAAMGESARGRVAARFTLRRTVAGLLAVYAEGAR